MVNPIKANALTLVKAIFELSKGQKMANGNELSTLTQLDPSQINDGIEYLDDWNLIERRDYMGTTPYLFAGVKLTGRGKTLYFDWMADDSHTVEETPFPVSSTVPFAAHNTIHQHASSVFESLFSMPIDRQLADAPFLQSATGIEADDLNEAVDFLDSKHWLDRHDYSGTAPFLFGRIRLTVRGKDAYYDWKATVTKAKTSPFRGTDLSVASVTSEQSQPSSALKKEVFVSYSWDDPVHESKVHGFVNFLRQKGFSAEFDKMLSQQQTSINFKQMMHQAMQGYEKVLVVLSPGYKKKAEEFKGGVGTEYRLLINDMEKNPTKYILFSFEPFSDDIIPFGLQGNEVVVHHTPGWENRLFSKLTGAPIYQMAAIAEKKPTIETVHSTMDAFPIRPVKLNSRYLRGASIAGVHHDAEFDCAFIFENSSSTVIQPWSVEVSIPKILLKDRQNVHIENDKAIITVDMTPIFPTQRLTMPAFLLKITPAAIETIKRDSILVTIFYDKGASPVFPFPLHSSLTVIGQNNQELLILTAFSPS